MSDRALILTVAAASFASFAWGMTRHFRRPARPTRGMLVTAALAALSTIATLVTLSTQILRFTEPALFFYGTSLILFWRAVAVTRHKLAACGQGAVSSQLVTYGPYRLIRHPFYTSYNFTWIAGLITAPCIPLAIVVVVMALVYESSAREEERALAAGPLAEEYSRYKQYAGKYFPRLARRRRLSEPHESNAIDQSLKTVM